MILEPGQYENVPVYTLLESAARGHIAVDHRFLHAILDRPEISIPELVRFAAANHDEDLVDLELPLIDIFRYLNTPLAVPFFVDVVRRNVGDVPDDLIESLASFGAAAVDPLLEVVKKLDDPGDIPFVLSELRVRDSRILDLLAARLAVDPSDAAFCLEVYGDPAAIPALESALGQLPADHQSRGQIQEAIDELKSGERPMLEPLEPFDIWELYPEKAFPDFDELSDDDRLAMLQSNSGELRSKVALSFGGSAPSLKVRARLLDLAKHDPHLPVRGACWEALGEISDEPEVHRAMLAVLQGTETSPEEKAGAAVALAQESDNPAVTQAIELLYNDARSRAQSLKAMARSLNRRYAGYPGKHLEDENPEIRRQALWCVGYLGLSSDAPRLAQFLEQPDFRKDALFAYALSIPGDTSPGRMNGLLAKIENAARGLDSEEETLVKIALDQRLMLHGKKPKFFPDEEA